MVLVPNIGISTSISNTTQIRPQHFRNFMCVHWECAFDAGSRVVAWELKIFTSGSVPLYAGSHVVAWEMKIFTSGCVHFDAGSHVVAWEM